MMNKAKKTIIWVVTVGITLPGMLLAQQNMTCTVQGKIEGADAATTALVIKRVGEFGADTLAHAPFTSNGSFRLLLPDTVHSGLYELHLSGMRGSVSFIAARGTVTIEGTKDRLFTSQVSGTPENDRWRRYAQFQRALDDERMQAMAQPFSNDSAKEAKFQSFETRYQTYVDSLMQHYPKSITSLYIAKIPLPMLKHPEIDRLLQLFKPYFAHHPYFMEMKERADILRKVAPGVIAPDFTVVKEDGKTPISLSDFRGKYVLLDFWASWCVPCRAENKHTKDLYAKYHPLGLEVVSFSLDSDLEAWQEAIRVDGLTWPQASDLAGGKRSSVATEYGIDGIPAIWIMDPNGKIIAEGIRGEALDQLLASIFIR